MMADWQAMRRGTRLAFAGVLLAAIGGCAVLGFLGGHGKRAALYKLPKDKQVLVLVDVRPEAGAPPTWGTMLGDRISSHLYQYKAADHLIGQDALLEMQKDPVAFQKMGVADIAQATGADIVIVVYIVELRVTQTAEGTVAQGNAEALVKVVDKTGTRLWPGQLAGEKVEAHVDPTLSSEKDKAAIFKELQDLMTIRVGRMFHDYDLEDKEMTRGDALYGK